jgi:hypothetical protein
VRARTFLFLVTLVACLASGASRAARAASTSAEVEGSFDARAQWVRQMPQLERDPVPTAQRTLPATTLPSTGSQAFAALTLQFGVAVDDRWLLPIAGMSFGWAVGSSPRVVTGVDGSIVELRPWSSDVLTVLLPGLGVRIKQRRWAFAAQVVPVVSVVWMNATVATGASSQDESLFAATLGARADLEACRRLDPVERLCVFVAPALYEFSVLGGGSAGLRMEVGP